MQKLTGLDEMFLSVDAAPGTNGVMGGLVIYERPEDRRAGTAAAMIERIEERIDALPPLRWKLAEVPLGLDHHYWAEADHVEVAEHVRTVTLAKPGSDQQLAAVVAEIMATPLDFSRPLWEIVVIKGLEGGRIAHLIRIHHGLIDGGSIPAVLDILSDHPDEVGFEVHSVRRDHLRGKAGMLARGLLGTATRPVRFAALQGKTLVWLGDRVQEDGVLAAPAFAGRLLPDTLGRPIRAVVNRRQKAAGKPEIAPLLPNLRRPTTPFNGRIDPARHYAFSDLPLADFKRVGKAYGVTLNDVVLAVVAGALRRYLADNGGIPDQPLVVTIPTSLRSGDEEPRWANHISMFFAELPTDIEDPVERLRVGSERVKRQKTNFDALPTRLIRPASEFIPMALWSVPQRLLGRAPSWLPTSAWNVVVSNVRGPAKPVSITGATMSGYWPAAFLTMGVGLNITLQSYVDRVDFGLMGAASLTGDLWEMAGYLEEGLAELLATVDDAGAVPSTPSNVPGKAKSSTR